MLSFIYNFSSFFSSSYTIQEIQRALMNVIVWKTNAHSKLNTTSLVCPKLFFCKQLSLVVNKYIRPKKYENGHKNIFGLSVVLELKVENSTILTFKVIFLCQKSTESFSIVFSLKNIKKAKNSYY